MSFIKLLLISTSLLASHNLHSQTKQDSSLIFERAKGLLNQPLKKYRRVPQLVVEDKYKDLLPKSVSYLCQNADSVRSIFEGKIISIAEINGSYMLMTNFGNYYIAYYGLTKPALKVGGFIKRNQFISTLSTSVFAAYYLNLQISKDNVEVNPDDWFKH